MTPAPPAAYDDDLRAPPAARLAGLALGLSALLVLAFAVAFLADDDDGALVLLLLLGMVTVPVLGAALLSFGPSLELLRGRRPLPRTPFCAGLLAGGHVGIAALALRPGADDELATEDLVGAGVGGAGLLLALLALVVTLPRRGVGRGLLVLLVGAAAFGAVVLRAVSQTA